MKDKNILTRFKGMVSESVGGRGCFLFSSYSINHLYTKLDHEIKLPIGVITIQKNHKVKWIYVVDNKDVYDKHTLPFIEDPSLMKKIEKFTKINAEAIIRELKSFDYRGTSSGDLFKFYKKFQAKYEDEIRVAGVFRLIDRSILPKLNNFVYK